LCVPSPRLRTSLGLRYRYGSLYGFGCGEPGEPAAAAIISGAVSPSATTFVAVVVEHDHAPEDALATVRVLEAEQDVSVRDAAVVMRTELGRIELQQTRQIAPGEGVVSGGTVGLVAGLLLGLPVGGALVSLAGGALLGMRDTGIPNKRLRKLGEELQPGQAVLCVGRGRGRAYARRARPLRHRVQSRALVGHRPVAPLKQLICQAARGQRHPERDEPVGERGDERLLRADSGRRAQSGQARLDEPQTTRSHGNQREQRAADVDTRSSCARC
jgi:uncharacterized membrane protein